MEIKELKRTPVEVSTEVDINAELYKEKIALADKAWNMFRYLPFKQDLEGKPQGGNSLQANRQKVAKAFEKVGIHPFDTAAVEQYKKEVIVALDLKHFVRNFCVGDVGDGIMTGAAVLGICLSIASLLTLIPGPKQHFHFGRWEYYTMPISIFLLSVWWVIAGIRSYARLREYRYKWNSIWIRNYTKPIPEFALAHAIALKTELPEADFFVHDLERTVKDHTPVPPDPFLWMSFGNEQYCFDVWEEPSFEARKIV